MNESKLYTSYEKVDGINIKVEKATGLKHMSFIDTGLKFFGHKVYEGHSFLEDNEYRVFNGYFMKDDIFQLDIRRNSKKLERKIGKTFKHFEGKASKLTWSQWFDLLSNDEEICTGKNNTSLIA